MKRHPFRGGFRRGGQCAGHSNPLVEEEKGRIEAMKEKKRKERKMKKEKRVGCTVSKKKNTWYS